MLRNKLNKAENIVLQPAGFLLLHIHGVIAIVLSIFCYFVFYHGTYVDYVHFCLLQAPINLQVEKRFIPKHKLQTLTE